MGKGTKAKAGREESKKENTEKREGEACGDCPKQKPGSITVLLKRSDLKKLTANATVELQQPSGTTIATKSDNRKVTFKGLAPGTYWVKTTLGQKDIDADYSIDPGDELQSTVVVSDKDSVVTVNVGPPGDLTVIVQTKDTSKEIPKVKVALSGTESVSGTTDKSGAALFKLRKHGKYDVALTLPDDVNKDYAVPAKLPEIDMPARQNHTVTLQVIPRAAPKIEVADPKVVIVKHPYHGQPKPGVPVHRIPVKLSSDIDYDGEGLLTCSPDDIEVYEKADSQNPIAAPWTVATADLKGKTVFIEAKKASGSNHGTVLKFELRNGTIDPRKPATEKITCVKLQLDIFKSRPEKGGDPAKLDEGPKLDPGRPVLVQQKHGDIFFAERAKLVLRRAEPKDFSGKLVLEAITASVDLYKKSQEKPAKGQTALTADQLKFDNTKIDASNGMTFWVEGSSLSGTMSDTGWKAGVEGVDGAEGDRVTMTAMEAELALFQSRSVLKATAEPTAFSSDDKYDKGRYLHKQHKQFHGRARIVVKKVKPDGFDGTLTLNCWDVTRKGSYSESKASKPKVSVFDDEVPATGQAAKAYPVEIPHPVGYSADGTEFWVEGSILSTKLRDAELRLGVKDFDKGCDRASFTVVQFKNLRADVPSTPANIVRKRRNGGPSNSPVPRHKFVAGTNDPDKHFDDDFGNNEPLPLVEGSVTNGDQVKLKVELQPAGLNIPVKWFAVRAFDDAAAIKSLAGNSEDPGIHADAAKPLEATMEANAAGSFRVRAYIDCNDNDKFDEYDSATGNRIDREPYIILNLVLFRVEGVTNTSAANSAAGNGLTTGGGGEPNGFDVGDFQGTGNDAVDMKAVIRVIGGGPAGLRGLTENYLFAGWVNNELNCPTAPNPNNWSEDVTHHHQRPAAAPAPRPLRGLRCFWKLDGARISGPILDAGGRYGNQRGTGGDSCIGTMAGSEPPINKVADPGGTGQNWTVANSDSPGGGIQSRHPSDARAQLIRFTFNINFQCALLVWTNVSKVPGPSDHAACRLYSHVQTNTWDIRFESTFDAAFVETNVTAKTVTFTKDGNPTRRAQPVDGSGFETLAPGGLNQLQADKPFDPNNPNTP